MIPKIEPLIINNKWSSLRTSRSPVTRYRAHSKNEMVVMTILSVACSYSLLFVDSSVKLICMHLYTFISHIITFSYDVYASFICDCIVIDVHPTHISLTHGFQGNKHVMDVNDLCL